MGVQAGTVTIIASQDGNDIVFSGSGNVDTTSLGAATTDQFAFGGASQPTFFRGFNEGGGNFTSIDVYASDVTNFDPLTPGMVSIFVSPGSDPFGVNTLAGDTISLPAGYVSGSNLNFTWRILNMDISALNFGTLATFGSSGHMNSVVLSQVPLPAAAWLFISALGVLIGMKRRRSASA
ncbi:MAG: VPLPA-CTERM sorting domain-containing protein [Pseudomonadota bacterium]